MKSGEMSGFIQFPNRIADKDDDREHAQNSSKRDVQAVDAGDNK